MAKNKRLVEVTINGIHMDIEKGASLAEIFSKVNITIPEGHFIILGRRTEDGMDAQKKLRIISEKGQAVIRLQEIESIPHLQDRLIHDDLSVQQKDANVLSIGVFESDVVAKYGEYELQEGKVYCDQIGLNRRQTALLLCRKKHTALYSLISPNPVGKVISGTDFVHEMKRGDSIIIEPMESENAAKQYSFQKITDLGTKISNNRSIIVTTIVVKTLGNNPKAIDTFLHVFRNRKLHVLSSTGSYISTKGMDGLIVLDEDHNYSERKRGMIFVRNNGLQNGTYYFYRSSRPLSRSHILIGEISTGMEMIDLAEKGDYISINTIPKYVNFVGMSQSNAENILGQLGHKQWREGDIDDDAIIVAVHPATTMEIARTSTIITKGVPLGSILKLRLLDETAPITAKYFRDVSGLTPGPIGHLRVEQEYSLLIGALLLNGDMSKITVRNLKAENIPEMIVRAGSIGVTNSVVDRTGIIGIRMKESDEFGPTLELFESTNIVGEITQDSLKLLKKVRNGQDIHIIETNNGPDSSNTSSC